MSNAISKINSVINKFSSSILNAYETIFLKLKKRPALGVVLLASYIYLYLSKSNITNFREIEKDLYKLGEQQETIEKLRKDLEIIALSSGFEEINFEEEWKNKSTKEKVSRLNSYAEELKKIGNLEESEKLYLEANKTQKTKTSFYNLASIYFVRKEYNKSIEYLHKVKEIDKKENYPIIDLYIGLSHQRLKNKPETNKHIKEFLTNDN